MAQSLSFDLRSRVLAAIGDGKDFRAIGAFAVSVLLCARMLRRGESVKILEIGSVVLFGLLVAYTLLAAPRWTVATVRLVVDGVQAAGIIATPLSELGADIIAMGGTGGKAFPWLRRQGRIETSGTLEIQVHVGFSSPQW